MKRSYTALDIANFAMKFYNQNDSIDTLKSIIKQGIEWAELKPTEELFSEVFTEILYRLA